MTRHPASRIGLAALRRERVGLAVLATLILSLQLFLAGWSGAAMAAANPAARSALCLGGEGGTKAPADHDHRGECPCLAGTCVQAGALATPAAAPAAGCPSLRPARALHPDPPAAGPDRRPLALFARAGRGPPARS